ncbi:phage portal protein [Limosilactobacillus vaginalis]|uniref:phage portal protein n=1 Tax=Limosilactobacillus vaginalis TaxID=1633 RepID=UPI0025A317F8|nr:phage portal protein [Limosilactobacillus vaginalis]MDM8222009.1 phage portal protein [Limosilactobacillus vaginalis]
MSLLNPFKNIKRSRTLANGTSPFMVLSGGKIQTSTVVDANKAFRNSDVFAVVQRISSDIASCSFNGQQYQTLLNNPFKLMNPYAGWQSVFIQLLLNGNAYVVMHENKNHLVTQFEPIPSDNVQLTLTDDAEDIIYTVHYNDERNDEDIPSNRMLHFKLVTPGMDENQYTGVSPLISLVPELGIQDNSKKLTLTSLIHAIAPTNIYSTPNALTEPGAREQIREAFEKANTGDNAGRILVMDAGAELKTIDVTPNVSKLLDNATFSQTQIAKAFGIPDSYLNGQGDQQSSIEMIRSLYQNALTMYIRPIESELTFKLGAPVHLDVTSAIDVDHQNELNNIVSLAKNNLLTPRQAFGLMIAHDIMPDLTVTDDDISQLNKKSVKPTTSNTMEGGETDEKQSSSE